MRIIEDDADEVAFGTLVDTMVRRFIEPRISGRAREPLQKEVYAELVSEIAATTGYFGARVPETQGGTGLSLVLAGALLERLPTFLGVSCVSQEATTYRVSLSSSDSLRERYLRPLIEGRLLGGTAVSEPDTGSDSGHPRARIIREGDGLRIEGSKLWTTNGSVADVLVVLGEDVSTGEVRRVLVDTTETAVRTREVPMLGLDCGYLAEVTFEGPVPLGNLLDSDTSTARSVLAKSWTLNRVSMALLALSIASRAVTYATEYAKEREQFGRKIGSFQLVQALLADAVTSVEASRLLCYRALSLLDRGVESRSASAMAKLQGTESAIQAVLKAQQVMGTIGVAAESPFDSWYRDVRMFTFPDGTSQIQQLIIGRELTGMSAFT